MRDLIGKTFGRLTVLRYAGRENYQSMWDCQCECGDVVHLREVNLVYGNNKSCGKYCYSARVRAAKDPLIKRALGCWQSAKQRVRKHARYLALGMHPEWKKNFNAFLQHIGKPPTQAHTIDRINNRIGYFPGNVRWATPKEQAQNRNDNWWISDEHIMDAARRTGIGHNTLRWRIRHNWPETLIFSKPNKALKHENRASA